MKMTSGEIMELVWPPTTPTKPEQQLPVKVSAYVKYSKSDCCSTSITKSNNSPVAIVHYDGGKEAKMLITQWMLWMFGELTLQFMRQLHESGLIRWGCVTFQFGLCRWVCLILLCWTHWQLPLCCPGMMSVAGAAIDSSSLLDFESMLNPQAHDKQRTLRLAWNKLQLYEQK